MDRNDQSSAASSPDVSRRQSTKVCDGVASRGEPCSLLPGTVFGDRYRIIELIGEGGMGEVYRADDLHLGHAVALKFLPARWSADPAALARLRNEVRIARRVSHPNVCRVYDVSEMEGRHFLIMEYVDGEDLGSVLRRLGRPTKGKAVQIAHQLCAGLAVAHENGVLHRDLKPANIMIDGRGQARILDFSVAGLARELEEQSEVAGTPRYMAPEQIHQGRVSRQSDLYSLGLVLYEIFTGQCAYPEPSLEEFPVARTKPPVAPSQLVPDLDPSIEGVILDCLENDPGRRPASAWSVAGALPGGDPVAAALKAGETPSPEMVAAAGGRGTLRGWQVLVLSVSVLAGWFLADALNRFVTLHRLAGPAKPGLILAEIAREILSGAGYTNSPADRRGGFQVNWGYLNYIGKTNRSPDRWQHLGGRRPTPYFYWYRESPVSMIPQDAYSWKVGLGDPKMTLSGMATLVLTGDGDLGYLEVLPPQSGAVGPVTNRADIEFLFEKANLDLATFSPVAPEWVPNFFADERMAWAGHYPGQPDWPIRVEAAAFEGRPVYFQIIDPSDEPWREPAEGTGGRVHVLQMADIAMELVIMVGVVVFARVNLRRGRCDRRGAWRLSLAYLVLSAVSWVLLADHFGAVGVEWHLFRRALWPTLASALFVGCAYLALEPYTRRLWPNALSSWTRLLMGRLGDPLVGRDILLGAVASVVILGIQRLEPLVPAWMGAPPRSPYAPDALLLEGGREVLGVLTDPSFMTLPFALTLVLTALATLLRRTWPAVIGTLGLMFVADGHWRSGDHLDAAMVCAMGEMILVWGILLWVLVRIGLLALFTAWCLLVRLQDSPLSLDSAAWYSGTSWVVLTVVAVVVAVAVVMASGRLMRNFG